MPKITPTVGRICLFHPAPDQFAGFAVLSDQPMAALVSHVNPDGTLNLAVADHDGNVVPRRNVTLVQEGDPALFGQFAYWMPYQVGQAAKTDTVTAVALTRLEEQAKRIDTLDALVAKLHAAVSGEAPLEQPTVAEVDPAS